MGYTEVNTDVLIGLGVSAISESPDCYHQNEKVLTVYERRILAGELPTLRGHHLTQEEQARRALITQVLTHDTVEVSASTLLAHADALQPLVADGLIRVLNHQLHVTETGRPFRRNIAAAFDEGLHSSADGPRYSTAV
jgi:coproporphyrinogen III oxidase-like Fe-S oxidoreductase